MIELNDFNTAKQCVNWCQAQVLSQNPDTLITWMALLSVCLAIIIVWQVKKIHDIRKTTL